MGTPSFLAVAALQRLLLVLARVYADNALTASCGRRSGLYGGVWLGLPFPRATVANLPFLALATSATASWPVVRKILVKRGD